MALLKGLVRQLLAHNSIVTTETRAKEVRRLAERLITLGREDTLANRRLSMKYLSTHTPVRRVRKPEGYNALHPNDKARVTEKLKNKKPERTGVSTSDFVNRLFVDISPRFKDRPGGYTRMFKLGFRRGDAAPLVKLELALED
ncbi:MAG: ribosomal protein [Armatimonadetes bacterium]|jgi:large subunit ribosomal protein L17|nr:ribosomal protein [Armatimonadota bacterium]